jgi:DNA-binding transcriptional ArsR family regulator
MLTPVSDFTKCDCNAIHEDVINMVRAKLPVDEKLFYLADLFKMFADSTRIKIVSALLLSEMCVCDLAVLLGMTKSAISHQLRALRQTRLVKYRKEGKVVYYSLDDDHVGSIIAQGLSHINEK